MYKTKQRKFYKAFVKGVKELGVTDCDYASYKYALETPLGKLYISIQEGEDSSVYSVCTKFAEVEKAKGRLEDLNPYSGKHNFHQFVKDSEPKAYAKYILNELKNILVMEEIRA